MRYLLDTHAFLWWLVGDSRLSALASQIMSDSRNEIWFSAASAWELAINARLGRITFVEDPISYIPRQVAANGFLHLSIDSNHALLASTLPLHHRDPFDRMLVAQALVENMVLLTGDLAISKYGAEVAWGGG